MKKRLFGVISALGLTAFGLAAVSGTPRPFQDRLRVGSLRVAECCDLIMSGVLGGGM
jgi:hypothetical protein